MDHFQGITAEIVSEGQALDFYDDPDAAETEDGRTRSHYVEAVAGSTFQVKVNLTPQFKFYKMGAEDAVGIWVKIDGNIHQGAIFGKKHLQWMWDWGKVLDHKFSDHKYFCNETNRWMRGHYVFGNLVLNESSDRGISIKKAQDIGKIQVTVQRIKKTKLHSSPARSTASFKKIDEVPEKALKGRPIETIVGLANTCLTSKPPDPIDTEIIEGEVGKPVIFNIHYRSRRALQTLGCIPRSPSPATSIRNHEARGSFINPASSSSTTTSRINNQSNASMTGTATAPDELLRQIQILNARISDLERDKVNAEAANTGTVIKNEGSGIKRERENDQINDVARQRRRTCAKIEHVDLTDD